MKIENIFSIQLNFFVFRYFERADEILEKGPANAAGDFTMQM